MANFFPDPAVSQQLIPLFELLSVGEVCALACCSSGWSTALNAWRSTEVSIPSNTFFSEDVEKWEWRFHAELFTARVKTIARKYTRLRSLSCEHLDLDASTLNLLARCTDLRSIECGQIAGPELVILAQAAQQLRVLRVKRGLDAPSLVALAQACPNLEELTCTIVYPYGQPPVRDADVRALADACPALRRLELKGSGYGDRVSGWPSGISDAAVTDLVSRCQHLVRLYFGVEIRDAKGQLTQIRPGLNIKQSCITIKVVEEDGNEIFFKIRMSARLEKLMNAYCLRQEVRMQFVRFLFDGARIRETHTPDDFDMEDGDAIDVMDWGAGRLN